MIKKLKIILRAAFVILGRGLQVAGGGMIGWGLWQVSPWMLVGGLVMLAGGAIDRDTLKG